MSDSATSSRWMLLCRVGLAGSIGGWLLGPSPTLAQDVTSRAASGNSLRIVPGGALPTALRLDQNSPNPFNPTTEIAFELDQPAYVRLSIYTLLGREVTRLAARPMEPGHYVQRFTAAGLPSGVYVYRLMVSTSAGSQTLSRRMMLLR